VGSCLGLDARLEPLVQRAAGRAGVPAAEVVAIFDDDPVLGTGYVMRRLSGETITAQAVTGQRFFGGFGPAGR